MTILSLIHRWVITALMTCIAITTGAAPPLDPDEDHRYHPPPVEPKVKIVVERRGEMTVELYKTKAPKTVAHFISLANRKFYDRVLFHNVIKGFYAYSGDPKSKSIDGSKIANLSNRDVIARYALGTGGSGQTVPIEPHEDHDRGTLALQHNIRDIDSGDSVFFINLTNNRSNNGAYTVFGRIIQGIDVMDRIQQGDRITSVRVIPFPGAKR